MHQRKFHYIYNFLQTIFLKGDFPCNSNNFHQKKVVREIYKGDLQNMFMKRGLIIFLGIVFLLNIVGASSSVAYVLKNPAKPDAGFMNVFHEMNLSIALIDDNKIKNTNFSNYNFVFIGDEKLMNLKKIPENKPIIIANKYYGKEFGFIGKGNINQFASNSPLYIYKNGEIPVYEVSKPSPGKINLHYYYIPTKNKINLNTIATTSTGYEKELGDVIAYSRNGIKKCFFGITETKYWTPEARNLFRNCVNFVLSGESEEPPENQTQNNTNQTMIHDVGINKDYANSIGGIRIQDLENDSYLLENISELMCSKRYKIDFKTENLGNFTENISFLGIIGNFNWSTTKENLTSGSSTTAGSKTINISFSPGDYVINISAMINNDANLENNFALRNIKVVCGEQNETQNNQTEGMIHDVGIVEDYSNSINGIRIRDDETKEYLINDSKLTCNKKYVISYKTMNYGNFTEDVSFLGRIANFSWTSTKINLTSGTSTTTGSKTINMTFAPGFYSVNITATIEADSNLADNFASRNVEVVC